MSTTDAAAAVNTTALKNTQANIRDMIASGSAAVELLKELKPLIHHSKESSSTLSNFKDGNGFKNFSKSAFTVMDVRDDGSALEFWVEEIAEKLNLEEEPRRLLEKRYVFFIKFSIVDHSYHCMLMESSLRDKIARDRDRSLLYRDERGQRRFAHPFAIQTECAIFNSKSGGGNQVASIMFRGLPDSTCVFFMQICTASFSLAPDWHIVTDTKSSSDFFHSKSTSTQRIVEREAAMKPENIEFLEQITKLKDPREVFPAFFLEDLGAPRVPAIDIPREGLEGGCRSLTSEVDERQHRSDDTNHIHGGAALLSHPSKRLEKYQCTSMREVEILDDDVVRTNSVFSRSFETEKSLFELVQILRTELQFEESLKPPEVIKKACDLFQIDFKGENMKPIAKLLVDKIVGVEVQ